MRLDQIRLYSPSSNGMTQAVPYGEPTWSPRHSSGVAIRQDDPTVWTAERGHHGFTARCNLPSSATATPVVFCVFCVLCTVLRATRTRSLMQQVSAAGLALCLLYLAFQMCAILHIKISSYNEPQSPGLFKQTLAWVFADDG